MRIKHREDDLQVACMRYMAYQYPHIMAIHVPNGGNRNPREAARLKSMGVKPGVPDILIFHRMIDGSDPECDHVWSGLAIELKVPPNKVTASQQEVMHKLEQESWITRVCTSFDQFKKEVDGYLME